MQTSWFCVHPPPPPQFIYFYAMYCSAKFCTHRGTGRIRWKHYRLNLYRKTYKMGTILRESIPMDSTWNDFPAQWERRAEPKFVCGLPLHTSLTLYNPMIKTTQKSTRASCCKKFTSLKGYGAEIFISDFSVHEWAPRKAPYSIYDFGLNYQRDEEKQFVCS